MNSIKSWPGAMVRRETTASERPPKSGRRLLGACRIWSSASIPVMRSELPFYLGNRLVGTVPTLRRECRVACLDRLGLLRGSEPLGDVVPAALDVGHRLLRRLLL